MKTYIHNIGGNIYAALVQTKNGYCYVSDTDRDNLITRVLTIATSNKK